MMSLGNPLTDRSIPTSGSEGSGLRVTKTVQAWVFALLYPLQFGV